MDSESGLYYLRARYYNPANGRFLTEDTHWNPGNMVYVDSPVKWNDNPNDPLGLNTYRYRPDIHAIMQSGNLYVYFISNPVRFVDPSGESITVVVIGGVSITLGMAIAAGIGVVMLGDLVFNNGRFTEDFIKGVFTLGMSAVDALKFANSDHAAKQQALNALGGGASAGNPGPDGPQGDYRKINERQFEREHGLKKNEFHRDIKQNILSQARQEFTSQIGRVGNNPNIHLDSKGFIRLVHATDKTIFHDTGWKIVNFLP